MPVAVNCFICPIATEELSGVMAIETSNLKCAVTVMSIFTVTVVLEELGSVTLPDQFTNCQFVPIAVAVMLTVSPTL